MKAQKDIMLNIKKILLDWINWEGFDDNDYEQNIDLYVKMLVEKDN